MVDDERVDAGTRGRTRKIGCFSANLSTPPLMTLVLNVMIPACRGASRRVCVESSRMDSDGTGWNGLGVRKDCERPCATRHAPSRSRRRTTSRPVTYGTSGIRPRTKPASASASATRAAIRAGIRVQSQSRRHSAQTNERTEKGSRKTREGSERKRGGRKGERKGETKREKARTSPWEKCRSPTDRLAPGTNTGK